MEEEFIENPFTKYRVELDFRIKNKEIQEVSMENFFKICKRQKPQPMPDPEFKDNWKQDSFLRNIDSGVAALQKGKKVSIIDDGRGFELACEIKRRFILEYQKQLSEKIEINTGPTITIGFKIG